MGARLHQVIVGFVFVLALGAARAEAKLVLVTWGETIASVGPARFELPVKSGSPPWQVGYKFSYVGVFFLDLWTWNGSYCIFSGRSYRTLTTEQAADMLGRDAGSLAPPLRYRWPLGWLALGAVAAFVVLTTVVGGALSKARLRLGDEGRAATLSLR